MAAELLAGVPVFAVVAEVVVALEDAVMLDDPMGRTADVGLQQGGREVRVVLRRQHVTDIVQECCRHRLVVGAVAKGTRRGLQRMLVAVDLVAFIAVAQLRQIGEHPVDGRRDEGLGELPHQRVVLGGAVLHADVAHGAFCGGGAVGHG